MFISRGQKLYLILHSKNWNFYLQLHESSLENEDQTQQIQGLKKKVQKLSNEAQDFKLQLEDSLQINTELEKRQRK